MNFAKQIALVTAAACMGLFLAGCESSDSKAKRVPTLQSLSVSPSAATVPLSSTLPLRVTATYSDSSTLDVTSAVRYTSSATAVAIVSSSGVVTAIRTGSATITATEAGTGQTATATIVVPQPSLVSIALRPVASTLSVGASQSLTVVATYSEGSTAVLATGVNFVSSNEAVATVSADGLLTAVAEGTATITATETQSGRTTTASTTVVAGGGGGGGGDFTAITFDDPAVIYTLTGFGGAEDSSVVSDPIGGTNKVARVVKSAAAELWAGTTVSTRANLSVGRIPFDAGNTRMQVRVYSPTVGIPVRLKVEDSNNPGVTVETEAVTTVANTWENLTFDFANEASGTAALDVSQTYDKASIFFNFGKTGAESGGEKIYFFDDLVFIGGTGGGGGGGSGAFQTITFDSATITYTLTGFGGAEDSTVAADPVGGSNLVARVVKSGTAELWAGTTVSTGPNQSVGKLPFDASNTRMTVRVYSPTAGIPVRLKVESAADPTITVETEAVTTAVNTWETLTFDFANEAAGTAALDVSKTYDKVSIFFNFGKTGAESGGAKIYFFDDLTFIGGTSGGGGGAGTFQTITFDSATVTYTLTGFGGAEDATVAADPAGGTNLVGRVVKSATAELWAGTTVSTGANQSVGTIPFSATRTRMTVRVYSPVAGIQVRLKTEDAADPTRSVETEATTTVANAWETLTFNFANQAGGTAALNLAYTYNKVSIFFDFGVTGAAAGGARTYHFDDVTFLP